MGFLWLFGLFAVFLSPAPSRITDQKMDKYEKRIKILAETEAPRQAAEQRWLEAELEVTRAKVPSSCARVKYHDILPSSQGLQQVIYLVKFEEQLERQRYLVVFLPISNIVFDPFVKVNRIASQLLLRRGEATSHYCVCSRDLHGHFCLTGKA